MTSKEEFKERKALLVLQNKFDKEKHENWMEALKYQRESALINHGHEMERQRIKSAEIRKMQERKSNRHFAENYHK
jgi:hypothetical protein